MDRRAKKNNEKVFLQLEWVKKRLGEKITSAGIKQVAGETGVSKSKLSSLDKLTVREFLILCAQFEVNPSSVIPDKPRFSPAAP